MRKPVNRKWVHVNWECVLLTSLPVYSMASIRWLHKQEVEQINSFSSRYRFPFSLLRLLSSDVRCQIWVFLPLQWKRGFPWYEDVFLPNLLPVFEIWILIVYWMFVASPTSQDLPNIHGAHSPHETFPGTFLVFHHQGTIWPGCVEQEQHIF